MKKENDMHAGKWNGLGGKFLPGETPEECAIREINEESGLVVKNLQLKGILTFPAFNKNEDWYCFVYVVDKFEGTITESTEGILQWIPNHKLLNLNLWEGDKIFIPWLEQANMFSGKFIYENGSLTYHQVNFYPCG